MLRFVVLLAACAIVAECASDWFRTTRPSGGGSTPSSGSSNCKCGDVPSGNKMYKQWVAGAKIVGGQMCAEDAAPWQCALVQYREGYYPAEFCGASIIGCRNILTASHCIDNLFDADGNVKEDDVKGIRVMCGAGDLLKASSNSSKIYKVLKVFKHPQYNQPADSTNNDVAVLLIDRPIKYDRSTQRVCLPTTDATDTAKLKYFDKSTGSTLPVAIVSGFGNQYEGQQKYGGAGEAVVGAGSDQLFQVTVPVWPREKCEATYKNYQYDKKKMICGGYPDQEKDSCQGDSGGPLVVERTDGCYEQMGVVSWGLGCARPGVPGIYADVFNLKDFIKQSIANSNVNCPNDV